MNTAPTSTCTVFSSDCDILSRWIASDSTRNCIPRAQSNPVSERTLATMFRDIQQSAAYIDDQKADKGDSFYNMQIHSITTLSTVPKPTTFEMTSIPTKIRNYIQHKSTYCLTFGGTIGARKVTIKFVVDYTREMPKSVINIYKVYFARIMIWLKTAFKYSRTACGNDLVAFLYLTPFTKSLPRTNAEPIGQLHANTAFTYTCTDTVAEIVVFRREEWFKVFVHETFHLLALDFSGMGAGTLAVCATKMKTIFPIDSKFALYESYTEVWATIINACFCSYFCKQGHTGLGNFKKQFKLLMRYETMFKVFQMHKILRFIGLEYVDLYSTTKESEMLRNELYRENTNVFSYSIAGTLLMVNYAEFLSWCDKHNTSLFAFKRTSDALVGFCNLIKGVHKTQFTLDTLYKIGDDPCFANMIENIPEEGEWIKSSLRMTANEMA